MSRDGQIGIQPVDPRYPDFMGSGATSAIIRQAPGFRMCVAAWFLTFGLFTVVFGAEALRHGSWPGALVALGILLVLGVVARRWASLAVTADGDRLFVRQFFSARTIARSEIATFRTGGSRRETPGLAVRVVLKDSETVILGATGWYFRTPEEVEILCAALESWLRTGALNVQ